MPIHWVSLALRVSTFIFGQGRVKEAAEWVQCRVIDLDKIMPMAMPSDSHGAYVVGFAEGLDVIFIQTDAGLFTFGLKSGLVKKVGKPGVCYSILPYMSFYTPGMALLPLILLSFIFTASICLLTYLS
jgi:hypothetical protein